MSKRTRFLCLALPALVASVPGRAQNNAPAPADVRALWHVEAPLFEELAGSGSPGLARRGSVMWGHLINQARLTKWALRNAVPYSLDDVLQTHGEHGLALLCHPATFLSKLETYREWHAKHGVTFTLYAFCYTRAAAAEYHYVLDPAFTDISLQTTERALREGGDLVAVVFTGDEQIETAMRSGVELLAEKADEYPAILDIDNRVREQFGFGQFGIPISKQDTNPFRRSAFARWVLAQIEDRQKRLHGLVRAVAPDVPIMGCDGMTGIGAFSFAERAEWIDIYTGQNWIGEQLNRSIQATAAAKLLADTTGREVWPACHINRIGPQNRPGPEELREFYSLLAIHGATGFHVYTPDNFGRGKPGDTVSFYFGHPARWRTLLEIIDMQRTQPPLRKPEPDYVLFYSNDAYQAAYTPGSVAAPHFMHAFAMLSPVARSWFRVMDETTLLHASDEELSRYKTVIVPFATYSRRAIPEQLIEYAGSGGTVICLDPDAFLFDLDGSSLAEVRELLLGTPVTGEGTEATQTEIRLRQSFLWPNIDTSASLPVWTVCRRIEDSNGVDVVATFADGSPAIALHRLGQGRVIVFACNPFVSRPTRRERSWLSDAVFEHRWQALTRALLGGLGIQLDHDLYRFRFPPAKPGPAPAAEGTCLTGNHVLWEHEEPMTRRNSATGGSYRYTIEPDAIADTATGVVRFDSGKLTDRAQAAKAAPDELPDARIVRWNRPDAFDVVVDVDTPALAQRLTLVYSGLLPGIEVRTVDNRIAGRLESREAGVDVATATAALELREAVSRLIVHFAPRPAGQQLTLAEIEVWGK